jgi:hypothetical protein
MKRLLREPLVHFLLIGAVLFGLYSFTSSGRTAAASSREIRLSFDEIAQLVQVFQSQWQREPTPEEFRRLVENKHSAMFALPPRLSFRHLYFSPDRRGARAREDAAKALVKLVGQPEDCPLAAALADRFMFQEYYRDRAPEYLGKEFGPQFALAVEKLTPGSWQGPIESGFGWHLVFVDTVIPGRVPAFEEIEPDVKTAWLGEQKALAWQKAYKEMRAKYTVLLPAPPDKNSPASPTPPAPTRVPTPSGEGAL